MIIKGMPINETERFLCGRAEISKLFSDFEIKIYFNKKELSETGKLKNVQYYYKQRPNYEKNRYQDLVASLSIKFMKESNSISLFLYPIPKEKYSESKHREFISIILPKLIQEYLFKGDEIVCLIRNRYYVDVKLVKNEFRFIEIIGERG